MLARIGCIALVAVVGTALGCIRDVFIEVGAGVHHVCGLRADLTISCWGDDAYAIDAPEGEFVSVDSGNDVSCAVGAEDGAVTCWGSTAFIGDEVPEGSFSTVSMSDRYACALSTTGEAVCWGPEFIHFDGTYREVTPGGSSQPACAVKDTGEVDCLGWPAPDETGLRGLAIGGLSEAGIGCGVEESNRLSCWNLVDGSEAAAPTIEATEVAISAYFGCVTQPGGELSCWELETLERVSPPPGRFMRLDAGGLGGQEVCGISTTGKVVCFASTLLDPYSAL